jgi:hypothetical protein
MLSSRELPFARQTALVYIEKRKYDVLNAIFQLNQITKKVFIQTIIIL